MRTVLSVPDISCDHCAAAITAALDGVQGVTEVQVELDTKRVSVDGEFAAADVVAAIVDAGYEVAGRV